VGDGVWNKCQEPGRWLVVADEAGINCPGAWLEAIKVSGDHHAMVMSTKEQNQIRLERSALARSLERSLSEEQRGNAGVA